MHTSVMATSLLLFLSLPCAESHHSESTNQGYSRKHDGGFYSCWTQRTPTPIHRLTYSTYVHMYVWYPVHTCNYGTLLLQISATCGWDGLCRPCYVYADTECTVCVAVLCNVHVYCAMHTCILVMIMLKLQCHRWQTAWLFSRSPWYNVGINIRMAYQSSTYSTHDVYI